MPNLVGEIAPLLDVHFDALLADGTIGKICLRDYTNQGKYIVLFTYPLDHTFVCPSEINAFSDLAPEFTKDNCVVIGASVDSVYSHFAWRETPRKKGGLGTETRIAIISDLTRELGVAYDCLLPGGHHTRATVIISDKGIVRAHYSQDPPAGRNPEEVLRLVQAYQFSDVHGEVCPAQWKKGAKTIKPTPAEKLEFFENTF